MIDHALDLQTLIDKLIVAAMSDRSCTITEREQLAFDQLSTEY
jgi:hypothetical protein